MATDGVDLPVGPVVDWTPADAPTPVTLASRCATLRPVDPGDADALYAATADTPSLWTYMGNGPFESVAELRAMLTDAATSTDPLFFTLVVDGRALGLASYLRITPDQGVIEIGHLLFAPALQRTTAATEVIYLLARHAFDGLGYRRLEWKCNALNAPSRRAALRFGFTYEGVFRQHMIVKGRNRDTAWYAIVDSDWPPIRHGFEAWLDPANFDPAGAQRARLAQLIAQTQAEAAA